ncbi:uncharacterized protein LOC131886939 isoform X2 [Tigriopus californicus]|uniref:uncharacterized protein LOC131886939 isoform X2 n=1 Tax=Tigriopus californicus TaxID=6832 RepID=UPI0027DA4EE5|nr:uncharacterized protein LOC131886939 isoform X2 [Tigriopus californicus]
MKNDCYVMDCIVAVRGIVFAVSLACPESHPWALANGTRCCQRFYRANDFTHDLDWYDPESLCFGGNVIPCPSFGHYQSLCRTNLKFKDPVQCPITHPITMRNACCKNYQQVEEGNCDGTLIETDDDPTCCRSDHLFQTQQCKDLKQRCLAPAPADSRTYCPPNPEVHRVNGQNYALISTANITPQDTMKKICQNAAGRLMTITSEKLIHAIDLLENGFTDAQIPRGEIRRYVVGAKKKTTNSKCFEENQCQGKVLDIITGDVIVFDDELSNLITSFDVKNVDNFIAFNIRLDTKHVEMVNTALTQYHNGYFICEVDCLLV